MLCEHTFLARNYKAKLLQVRPNIIKFSYLYVPCKIRFTGPTDGHSKQTYVENALSHEYTHLGQHNNAVELRRDVTGIQKCTLHVGTKR